MTTKIPALTAAAKSKLITRIAAAQKQADSAKKTAKSAKVGFKQARQKFKDAKRAARKLRKAVKELKAELAALSVSRLRRKPVARKSASRRSVPAVAPASAQSPVENLPTPAGDSPSVAPVALDTPTG